MLSLMSVDPGKACPRVRPGIADGARGGDGDHRPRRIFVEAGAAALCQRRRRFHREKHEHADGHRDRGRTSHFHPHFSPVSCPFPVSSGWASAPTGARLAPRRASQILSRGADATLIWNNGSGWGCGGGNEVRGRSGADREGRHRATGFHPDTLAFASVGDVSCSASGWSAGAGRGVPTALPTNCAIRSRALTDLGKNSSG